MVPQTPPQPPRAPSRTIFVSHAHADNALCDRYVEALRRYGLDVWYDRTNLQAGHLLSDEIQTELERRTAFVVLLTPAAVESFWVKAETDAYRALAARDPSRLIVPVRIEACEVPLLLQGLKWVDATAMPFAAAVEEIVATLGVPVDQRRVARSTRRWRRGRRLRSALVALATTAIVVTLVAVALASIRGGFGSGSGGSGGSTPGTGGATSGGRGGTSSVVHHTFTSIAIPTPNSNPQGVTVAADGTVWFTEGAGNKIGSLTPQGAVNEFAIPSAGAIPEGIVLGPDGNLWFTEGSAAVNKIGRMTPSGVFAEFPIPSPMSFPRTIIVGPDDNLWFTEEGVGKIGRVTVNGEITEFTISSGTQSFISSIAVGSDGNLWFTEGTASKVGRITPSGVVAEFPMPADGPCPLGITAGPDGNLWFREGCARNVIGKVTPNGDITEYPFPGRSDPGGITTGKDGNLWFLSQYSSGGGGADKIGAMTSAGSFVMEYVLSTTDTFGRNIVTGPDGTLWFAVGDAIGRFTP